MGNILRNFWIYILMADEENHEKMIVFLWTCRQYIYQSIQIHTHKKHIGIYTHFLQNFNYFYQNLYEKHKQKLQRKYNSRQFLKKFIMPSINSLIPRKPTSAYFPKLHTTMFFLSPNN